MFAKGTTALPPPPPPQYLELPQTSKAEGEGAAGGGYGVTIAEKDATIAIPETEEEKAKRLEEEMYTLPDDEVLLPRPGLLDKIKGKIYEQVPELPIDVEDLKTRGVAIPLILTYLTMFLFALVYFAVTGTFAESSRLFLSADFTNDDSTICAEVPLTSNGAFMADITGTWETKPGFNFNRSIYVLDFKGAEINNDDYASVMQDFSDRLQALGAMTLTRDVAFSWVAWSTFNFQAADFEISFYSNAKANIIFNLEIGAAAIANQNGVCTRTTTGKNKAGKIIKSIQTSDQAKKILGNLNVASNSFDVVVPITIGPDGHIAASEATGPCPDQGAIQNVWGWTEAKNPDFKLGLSFDIATTMTVLALNMGLIHTEDLQMTRSVFSLDYLGLPPGNFYVDPFYVPMTPLFCLDRSLIVQPGPDVCFYMYGQAPLIVYPTISQWGATKKGHVNPCSCPTDKNEPNCNKPDILIGFFYNTDSEKALNKGMFALGLRMQAMVVANNMNDQLIGQTAFPAMAAAAYLFLSNVLQYTSNRGCIPYTPAGFCNLPGTVRSPDPLNAYAWVQDDSATGCNAATPVCPASSVAQYSSFGYACDTNGLANSVPPIDGCPKLFDGVCSYDYKTGCDSDGDCYSNAYGYVYYGAVCVMQTKDSSGTIVTNAICGDGQTFCTSNGDCPGLTRMCGDPINPLDNDKNLGTGNGYFDGCVTNAKLAFEYLTDSATYSADACPGGVLGSSGTAATLGTCTKTVGTTKGTCTSAACIAAQQQQCQIQDANGILCQNVMCTTGKSSKTPPPTCVNKIYTASSDTSLSYYNYMAPGGVDAGNLFDDDYNFANPITSCIVTADGLFREKTNTYQANAYAYKNPSGTYNGLTQGKYGYPYPGFSFVYGYPNTAAMPNDVSAPCCPYGFKYDLATDNLQQSINSNFQAICPDNLCAAVVFEIYAGSSIFNPLNQYNVMMRQLSQETFAEPIYSFNSKANAYTISGRKTSERIACADTFFKQDVMDALMAVPPQSLVQAYYVCHATISAAAQTAIGAAQGSAALYSTIVFTVIVFLMTQYINFAAKRRGETPLIPKERKEALNELKREKADEIMRGLLGHVVGDYVKLKRKMAPNDPSLPGVENKLRLYKLWNPAEEEEEVVEVQEMEGSELVGTVVVLHGLAKAIFNGATGRCTGLDVENKLFRVTVTTPASAAGRKCKVRRENLLTVEEAAQRDQTGELGPPGATTTAPAEESAAPAGEICQQQ